MVMDGPNGVAVDPTTAKKAEQLRADVAFMINNGYSRDDIGKRVAQDGYTIDQVTGIDAALKYRADHPHDIIPVGFEHHEQPAPVEKHGPDKGRVHAAIDGALDALGLGATDEIGAAIDAGGNSVGNLVGLGDGQSYSDRYDKTLADNRQQLADDQYYHPGYFASGQVAGTLPTLFIPGGAEENAGRIVGRAALEGAAYNGAYGFNSSNGDFSDRLKSGAESAAIGGVTGVALSPLSIAAARIAANRAAPSEGRAILDAADRLNVGAAPDEEIRPLVAHTSNGGMGSNISAMAEPLILPGYVSGLRRSAHQFEENAGLARDRIANDAAGGSASDLTSVAARTNDAAQPGSLAAYEDASKQVSNSMYDHAGTLAGDTRLTTPRTINKIDNILARWREVPGGVAGSGQLADLREQLDGGNWTVDGLRRLRTSFGDGIDSNNRTVREAAKSIWPTLSQDITRGLQQRGLGDAAKAYRSADQNFAQRLQNVDLVKNVIGDGTLSADQVAGRIQSMSRSDYDNLAKAISVASPDHQSAIRGALIDSLGKATAGTQDASGDRFSLNTFLTQWSKLSDQAKAATFSKQTTQDLNDLATLGGGLHPVTILPALTVWGGGKLLASPGFARALVRSAESKSLEVFSRRLAEVARRQPAMANQILGFRDQVINGGSIPSATIQEKGAPTQPQQGPIAPPMPVDSGNPFDQFDE
jgi:hypothetical protein